MVAVTAVVTAVVGLLVEIDGAGVGGRARTHGQEGSGGTRLG